MHEYIYVVIISLLLVADFIAILFYAFYKKLKVKEVEILDIVSTEKVVGNGIIYTTSIRYKVDNKDRKQSFITSGQSRNISRLKEKHEKLIEFYKKKYVNYYHLPLHQRAGLIQSPNIYTQVWVAISMFLLLSIFLIIVIKFWF